MFNNKYIEVVGLYPMVETPFWFREISGEMIKLFELAISCPPEKFTIRYISTLQLFRSYRIFKFPNSL
jgi:hypothetical protein